MQCTSNAIHHARADLSDLDSPMRLLVMNGAVMVSGFWRRFGSWIIEPPSKTSRQLVMDANLIVHAPKLLIW